MGDWYDVILTVDLRPDTPPAELAELRWHLGLGERPADLTIVTGEPGVLVDEDGDWVFGEDGTPIVDHASRPVVVRQELHPDELDPVDQLITWLAQHTRSGHYLGSIRFHEEDRTEPLVVHNEQVYRGNTSLN
ncbi:hypothetical protein OHB24_29200 [Kribbella sp. NBC_00482]|uniref:hypothetical protein n=1 Tax=Kribbella sp. NBC_00482 TaxID=2975968 RepID=UPI002E19AAC2